MGMTGLVIGSAFIDQLGLDQQFGFQKLKRAESINYHHASGIRIGRLGRDTSLVKLERRRQKTFSEICRTNLARCQNR